MRATRPNDRKWWLMGANNSGKSRSWQDSARACQAKGQLKVSATMEEAIKRVSAELGISEKTVRDGVKVLLQFARKHAAGAEWEKLIARIPGAAELVAEPAPEGGSGNSLFGSLGGLLGGQAGDAAKVLSGLQAAGLPTAQIGPFVKSFFEKMREIVGPETMDEILKKMPLLQNFLKS